MVSAVLGIDIGTRSTKAMLIGLDGDLLGVTSVEHPVTSPAPGLFEHDPERVWWQDTVTVIRGLIELAPHGVRVAAVGLSSCGPCLVPIDAAGQPLRAGILYGVDTRACRQIKSLERRIGTAEVLARYGMPLTSQTVGPKVQWIARQEPKLYARTSTFLTANGYVAFRLTRRRCVDHHQAAYFAPYYRNGAWDPTYDEDRVISRLPDLVWSTEVIGQVTAEASSQIGLPRGIPVVIGSSDGLTGAYGAGALHDGEAVLNYGSTLAVTAFAPRSAANGGVWRTPGARPEQDSLAAGLSTGGVLTTWFREHFARDLPTGDNAGVSAAHAQLAKEARRSVPGARNLLLLPYFAGERTPIYDPGAAGVLLGLRLHHTRGDLYRAILEGTAHGVRHVLDEMTRMSAPIIRIRAIGGGTATPLWLQIVTDITGVLQQTISPHHGAPLGAAFLAALGTGLASDDDQLDRWIRVTSSITPNARLKASYDRRHQIFLDSYHQTRSLLTELDAPNHHDEGAH